MKQRRKGRSGSAGVAGAVFVAAAVVWPGADTLADDAVVGPGNCNEVGFVSALDQVQSTGGGTITFNCGATPVTIPFGNYRQISTPVVIDGGNRIVFDGGNSAAFFQVFFSASLELRRLTLRRGAASASHPLENFGQLRMVGVTAEDNVASVLLNYGTAVISNSRFVGNRAPVRGAAIDNDSGTVLIVNTEFSDNIVNQGNSPGTGGAIINTSSEPGALKVRYSTFDDNSAFDGGAIYNATGTTGTRIEHSVFTGNQAGYGGAIENRGNGVGVHYSRFEGNSAQVGDGGAIWALEGGMFVAFSQFSGNSAATTGGAVSCYGNWINLYNSSFGSNQSGGHGGAVYSTCAALTGNSTFHGNIAMGSGNGGGAMYQNGPSSGFVFYSTLTGNSASYGGGIASDGSGSSEVQVFGSILAGNTTGNCGGVFSSGGYNLSSDSHCAGAFTATGDANSVTLALLAYGDHGGPTLSRPPQAGNPAINRIPAGNCAAALFPDDQRGALRPVGGACDSGAYEIGGIIDLIFADGFQ